ncbi:hypothetical protein EVAR_9804_1 [Eumeta japonica]|uniref:Uncharacterized protein n=1 Tax=Eumeta variegata TaxID=151549 RepID=A0A4C1U5N7_EUMVA|nr:hypothetical protein EVAR_9804_1 [Eumeta japonica]
MLFCRSYMLSSSALNAVDLFWWYRALLSAARTLSGRVPEMTHTASCDIVRKALATLSALSRHTGPAFLHASWIYSVSAQMDIPYVRIDVTTDDSSRLLLCFGPPTFGINRARLALTTDALALTCSTFCLKLSRASIITPKYRMNGCDVIRCLPTSSVIVFNFFLLVISTASVL